MSKKYDVVLYCTLLDDCKEASALVTAFGPAQADLRILSRSLEKGTKEYIRVRKAFYRNRRLLRKANKQIRRFYKFCDDNGI